MADTSKSQKIKLANSRKRFKELQQLKTQKNHQIVENIQKIDDVPVANKTDSPGSCNDISDNGNISLQSTKNNTFHTSYSHQQVPIAPFSANYAQEVLCTDDKLTVSNYFTTSNNDNPFENVDPSGAICDQQVYSLLPVNPVNDNKGEESLPAEICDNSDNQVEDLKIKSDAFVTDTDLLRKKETEYGLFKPAVKDYSSGIDVEVKHSNVESLKQLSNQVAELIEPQFCSVTSGECNYSITDLEKRNLELAALLEQEKVKSEKNNIFINELQNKINYLEDMVRTRGDISNIQSSTEINKLREELQSHLQTIGMLVAEKTELSVNLNKFEICSKQKIVECEELHTRLKASRSRVAELEKEISNLKMEKYHNENAIEENKTIINILKRDYENIKEQKEELLQDFLETKEKLKNCLEENLKLQQSHQDIASKLALTNIKLQQITANDQQQIEGDLQKVTEEKFTLERELTDLTQLLKTMTKERDESVLQYQQYAQQQNMHLNNLTKEIEKLQRENENLVFQEQNRIKHISELEKQLQNLQIDQVSVVTDKISNNFDLKSELKNVQDACIQLQIEKTTLEEGYTKASNENEMLLKELEAKNDSVLQLQGLVEQLQGNQPDSVKLLATMESDKIAAARAVQQNKELKQHIESLEEVLLKLNNDKVDLTEDLSKEVGNNKELLKKLQKTELHLQRLTEAVEIKDHELLDLRQHMAHTQKQLLQNEQVNDLLRHYEVQDSSSLSLQNELKEAKDTIVKLTNEINILKHSLSKNEDNIIRNEDTSDFINKNPLQVNKDNIMEAELSEIYADDKFVNSKRSSDVHETLDKEVAVRYLEEKFKSTMQDIADLQEEKQNLEHLVLQLQGETETIGEYVALYHHQRMILKQRALEKDQQLKQLTNDREYLKTKLEKLDDLLRELVNKNTIGEEYQQSLISSNAQEGKTDYDELENDHHLILVDNIVTLLSEIKSSNLIQPKENAHHCAWCSGQLITV